MIKVIVLLAIFVASFASLFFNLSDIWFIASSAAMFTSAAGALILMGAHIRELDAD